MTSPFIKSKPAYIYEEMTKANKLVKKGVEVPHILDTLSTLSVIKHHIGHQFSDNHKT